MVRKDRSSGLKIWLFRVLALILPLACLALVELAFRIAGVARPEPLFLEVRTREVHKFQTNPRVAERDFPPALARIMPRPGFQAFDAVKPEGLWRVFCLGASTTAGFPFPAHVSYPALLAEKLRLYLPDRRVEVINCGISAVSSFTLVDFTREVLRHQPDLIVVYTGHNEYYGAWGAASAAGPSGAPAAWIPFLRWLQRLRIWRWLTRLRGEPEIAPGTLMERMVARPQVDPRGPVARRARRDFRDNLRRIIRLCRRDGVPVVFCEPVSNLADTYPFGSLAPDDPAAAQARRGGLWRLEKRLVEGEMPVARVREHWRTLIAGDSASADLWYHGGWLAAKAQDTLAAAGAYVRARDWDTVPFRAGSDILQILRETCREERVPIVPLTRAFERAAQGSAPGRDLFVEHLHPNLAGQLIVAEQICAALEEMGWPGAGARWERDEDPGPRAVLEMAGLTPLDALYADLRVLQLMGRWPYAHPQGMRSGEMQAFLERDPLRRYPPPGVYREADRIWEANRPAAADREVAGVEEQLDWPAEPDSVLRQTALMTLAEELTILEAHRRLGRHHAQAGDYARAFVEYRAAARLFPVDPGNFIRSAQMLMAAGRMERARGYLLQALSLAPGRRDLMAIVAECDLQAGRFDEARLWVDRILAVDAGNAQALRILREIEKRAGVED